MNDSSPLVRAALHGAWQNIPPRGGGSSPSVCRPPGRLAGRRLPDAFLSTERGGRPLGLEFTVSLSLCRSSSASPAHRDHELVIQAARSAHEGRRPADTSEAT